MHFSHPCLVTFCKKMTQNPKLFYKIEELNMAIDGLAIYMHGNYTKRSS